MARVWQLGRGKCRWLEGCQGAAKRLWRVATKALPAEPMRSKVSRGFRRQEVRGPGVMGHLASVVARESTGHHVEDWASALRQLSAK